MRAKLFHELWQALLEATNEGLYPPVGYALSLEKQRIWLLTTSINKIPLAMEILKKSTGEEYNLGRHLQEDRLQRIAQENPHVFIANTYPLEGFLRGDLRQIGKIVQAFGAPFFRIKAFGLVDICGFAKCPVYEQLSMLYSLSNALRSTVKRCARFCSRLGVEPRFDTASTGDGFYFWHPAVGANADVATFMVLLCLMQMIENLRVAKGHNLQLRASYVAGEAFVFYNFEKIKKEIYNQKGEIEIPESFPAENAVGPATNVAARLCAAAEPSQILVAEFRRSGHDSDVSMDLESLIRQAAELFREEDRRCAAELRFDPETTIYITDKHSSRIYCRNLVGQIPYRSGGTTKLQRIGLKVEDANDIKEYRFKAGF